MRYLMKVLLLLVLVAFAATIYLFGTEGRDLNWEKITTLPKAPDLSHIDWPSWDDLPFLSKEAAPPVPSGRAWVGKPGEEPQMYLPFTPGRDETPDFPQGTYFRWQDVQGTWNYTPGPQPGVLNYPILTHPEQNILPPPGRNP